MVIFFKQNFQDIIFTPSREDMNTQKWFRDHLKTWPFSGPDPLEIECILFYSILFYSILFYSILFYSILFYYIIFYSILLGGPADEFPANFFIFSSRANIRLRENLEKKLRTANRPKHHFRRSRFLHLALPPPPTDQFMIST